MKKLFVVASLLALTGMAIKDAHAVPALAFASGADSMVVVDGDPNDLNPAAGIVAWLGPIGPNWQVSGTGFTDPITGPPYPHVDLLAGGVNLTTPPPDLFIAFTNTGLTANPTDHWQAIVGGTTQGQVTFDIFTDPSDTPFGLAELRGVMGPFSGGGFIGAAGDDYPATNPFSLTLLSQISHSGIGQLTTFNFQLTTVPEPATMMLLGAGLLGVAAIRRRKKD